jgi:hypothetical protein
MAAHVYFRHKVEKTYTAKRRFIFVRMDFPTAVNCCQMSSCSPTLLNTHRRRARLILLSSIQRQTPIISKFSAVHRFGTPENAAPAQA